MKKIFVVMFVLLCLSVSYAKDSNTLTIAWPSNVGPFSHKVGKPLLPPDPLSPLQ